MELEFTRSLGFVRRRRVREREQWEERRIDWLID